MQQLRPSRRLMLLCGGYISFLQIGSVWLLKNISLAGVAISTVLLHIVFVYSILSLSQTVYAMDRQCLYRRTGLLFCKQQTIPFDSMRYAVVQYTPFARLLGIAMLSVYVNGGRVQLYGIPLSCALHLQRDLLHREVTV